MVKVPRNWNEKSTTFRLLLEHFPAFIGRFWPEPSWLYAKSRRLSLVEEGDPIPREPVLMRTLPRSRFTGLFSEEASLPLREAETLEEFEAELRRSGFIADGQVLVQSFSRPTKFRVKVDKFPVHFDNPSVKGPGSASPEKPLDEVPSPLHAHGVGVKGEERERPLTLTQRMEMDMMRQILQCKSGPKGGA